LAFAVFCAILIVFKRSGQRYPNDLSDPARVMVERSFAWINHHRCLARALTRKAKAVAAFFHLTTIRLVLRRLTTTLSA
jgi:hypothetical protein